MKARVLVSSCVAAFAALAIAAPAGAASTTKTFSTTGPLALPASGVPGLYPWTINVAGFGSTATTSDVNVTLTGLSHERVSDLDVLLEAPGSGRNVLFMSDVGDDTDIPAPGINLTFDDSAQGNAPVGVPLVAGTYRPTNAGVDPDPFIAPAPAGPFGATMAALKGGSPNGGWDLYLTDDDGNVSDPAAGILNGWSLRITSTTPSSSKTKKPKKPSSGGRHRCRGKHGRKRVRCLCRHSRSYLLHHPRKCRRVLGRRR
jgi:subtilisin-like proprotein convertase family protein